MAHEAGRAQLVRRMGLLDWFKKRPSAPAEPPIALAMPLLGTVDPVPPFALDRELAAFAPGARWGPARQDQGMVSLDHPTGVGAVSYLPAQVPAEDLARAIRSSWHWPDAGRVVPKHRSHAVASAQGGSKVEATLLLTTLVAGILRAHPEALGVYWGSAGMVLSKAAFLHFATGASRTNLPTQLWINVLPLGSSADGTRSVRTVGMKAFGLMELELRGWHSEPKELLNRTWTFADYLLEHGPVLADGATIGDSATEKCRIRHLPASDGTGEKVYCFDPPAD